MPRSGNRTHRAMLTLLTVVAVLAPVAAPTAAETAATATAAAPTCAADDTTYGVTGRVFPAPEASAGYLTFDEFAECIAYLAQRHPGRVTLESYGTSREGRDLHVVEVTDSDSPVAYADREQLLVDASIHGSERVGVEASVRLIEDLATTDDPELLDLLRHQVLVVTFPNPDGWSRGDRVRAGNRANAAGVDINRTFPSIGYVRSAWRPLEQPESAALHSRYSDDRHDNAAWGMSLHGYTVATRSFNQILLMAGQYDLEQSLRNEQAARDVVARMVEATRDQALRLGETAPGMENAAMYGTVWETRRALNTGFVGNWLAMPQPVGRNLLGFGIEHWLNENTPFTHPHVAYQVAAGKAALLATMEAMRDDPQARLELAGPVGYLRDNAVVTHESPGAYVPDDGFEASLGQRPFAATRMAFFDDLAPYAGDSLIPLTPGEVTAEALDRLQAFVITEDSLGVDPAVLRAYAERGGTVVLTDGALRALPDLVDVAADAVVRDTGLLVRMDDGVGGGRGALPGATADPADDTRDFNHPLLAGLDRADSFAEQLYEPVPLGFSLDDEAAPWWSVDAEAFAAAGGRAAALDPEGRAIVGDVPVGEGAVVVVGGLLPQPTNDAFHPWGLADYSLTYTGYRVLLNAIGATAALE